jgi:hypothetical protein
LAGIRTDSLKTGILLDRVYSLSSLRKAITSGSDTISGESIFQALTELKRASYSFEDPFRKALSRFDRLKLKYQYSDTLPLMILN